MRTLTWHSRRFKGHFAKKRTLISFFVEEEFEIRENFPNKNPYSIRIFSSTSPGLPIFLRIWLGCTLEYPVAPQPTPVNRGALRLGQWYRESLTGLVVFWAWSIKSCSIFSTIEWSCPCISWPRIYKLQHQQALPHAEETYISNTEQTPDVAQIHHL